MTVSFSLIIRDFLRYLLGSYASKAEYSRSGKPTLSLPYDVPVAACYGMTVLPTVQPAHLS